MSEANDRRYPLHWPEHRERTPVHLRRQRSRYEVSQSKCQRELKHELSLMGAKHVVISTNVQLRRDGLPYASHRAPEDGGVAVYWTTGEGVDVCIACDQFGAVRDNMRAIGITVASLRAIKRAGATKLFEQAYRGFAQLPPLKRPWREVLGANPDDDHATVKRRYREMARQHHPDHGGVASTMAVINDAWADARRELSE